MNGLIARLSAFYGPLPHPPPDAFGVYLWEVLGLRTTSSRRDAALAALRRVPALTPDSLSKLGRGRLEAIVRLCGPLADERLRAIETGIDVFRRRHGIAAQFDGPLSRAWIAARDLPHLGEGGAARLLLYASPHGLVPVDEGLARLAVRLGLVRAVSRQRRLVRSVRRTLDEQLPRDLPARRLAVLYLTHHAQHTCVEPDPHCGVCPISQDCPEGARRSAVS